MKVTMPRYELQPVTMARMENSNTCGSLYFCPCPRRGSGTSASRSSNGANVVTATSDSVAAPGVRHPPIRESLFSSAASLRTACVAARTHFSLPNSIEQPWSHFHEQLQGDDFNTGSTKSPLPRAFSLVPFFFLVFVTAVTGLMLGLD